MRLAIRSVVAISVVLGLAAVVAEIHADSPVVSPGKVVGTASTASAEQLVDAAERQDWDQVSRLVGKGVPIDGQQADGMTALHWAAFHGNAAMVSTLIRSGAAADSKNRYGVTPLSIACQNGNAAIVRSLAEAGADVDARLPSGETILMIASRTGNADAVRTLLANGAKTDAAEPNDQTALMWAAHEGNVEAVDALIDAGADVERKLSSGFSALLLAVRESRDEVVWRLIDAGADMHAVMKPKHTQGRAPRRGMSALMIALESGHFELAIQLVESGADPNDQRSGYAPLHALTWVRKANRGEGVEGDPIPRGSGRLSSLHFVRKLVDLGADVNLRLSKGNAGRAKLNPQGATPLLMAAKTADLPLIQLLVELGADPLQPNHDGCTPLMAAAGIGVVAVDEEAGTEVEVMEVVQYLIDLGGELNTVDANGETAMHGAAYRSFPKVAQLLIDNGANADIWHRKNKHGWTPLRIAQGYRPGSFKPSPPLIHVIKKAMNDAGIETTGDSGEAGAVPWDPDQ